jgi:hypothetical protein
MNPAICVFALVMAGRKARSAVFAPEGPAIHVFAVARPQDVDARLIGAQKHAVLWTALAGHDAELVALLHNSAHARFA